MFVLFFCLFEIGFCYVVQAGLKLNCVAQTGLELEVILLPQPHKCQDYRLALQECTTTSGRDLLTTYC